MTSKTISPTMGSERIVVLDILRGFAILGILIMNVQSFSMISAAYTNPLAYGDLTGFNKIVHYLSHIFADKKFMTLFAMLFGAGIILFSSRAELKQISTATLHYRRTFGLIFIGLLHAYLLWYGDILVTYGICALFVFLFRKVSPKWLLINGFILFGLTSILYLFFGFSMPYWNADLLAASKLKWLPNAAMVSSEVAAYQGGWFDQMLFRVPMAKFMETQLLLMNTLWRTMGIMLMGMALYKWGVLTAQRSKKFYLYGMIIGFGIGIPIVIYGIIQNFAAGCSFEYSMFFGSQFNYWASLLVSFGFISMVMTIHINGAFTKLQEYLADVGKLAFTNYLMQTIICTTIFYGHGFGLFGKVDRSVAILIVIAVWIVQLFGSHFYLRYFRYGPFEWIWRSMTYLKAQPFRK